MRIESDHPGVPALLEPEQVAEKCREAGLKATAQRVAIFQQLLATETHPTPEWLFHQIRPQMPGLSLGTVYKTLDALEQAGLARKVSVTGQAARFDARTAPHHHLICSRCHTILDLFDAALDNVAPSVDLDGFRTEQVSIQIHGLCRSCASDPGHTKENEYG